VSDLANRCAFEGHIGGLGFWLPQAPWVRDWGAPHPRVLCNHVRCKACGEVVRHVDGAVSKGEAGVVMRGVPATIAFDEALVLVPDAAARTYACGCRSVSLAECLALAPSAEPERALNLPWVCAGHPALALPAAVDGVPFDDATLEALVAHALAGRIPAAFAPAGVALFRHPSVWLAHIAASLEDPGARDRMGHAAASRLDDADPKVRRAAINLYRLVPGLAGHQRLGEVLRQTPHLFDGVPAAMGRDLGYELRECLEWHLDDPLIADVVRDELVQGRGTPGLLFAIARVDRGFVLVNQAVVAATSLGPERVQQALARTP